MREPPSLKERLRLRYQAGNLRTLSLKRGLIDFCSNDYLGFARSKKLHDDIGVREQDYRGLWSGATGSRLLSGNSSRAERLEITIARFHQTEAALLFSSGYTANLGLLSCVPQRHDAVLYDELCHASIRDGLRLGLARSSHFRHNSLQDLERLLHEVSVRGDRYIVVESLYSVDGDLAPLQEVCALASKYQAHVIVDEAHATGVYGAHGAGRVQELQLESSVFARVHTFGKALGCHGGAVVGSKILKNFLINYCRPFIYTTALPPHTLLTLEVLYGYLALHSEEERGALWHVIEAYHRTIEGLNSAIFSKNHSPIQYVLVPGNEAARSVAHALESAGFDARPLLSPTVPQGHERIRICVHSFNSAEDVERLLHTLQKATGAM